MKGGCLGRRDELVHVGLLALAAGCTPAQTDTGWMYESGWNNEEPTDHAVLVEGLDNPRGLASKDGGFVVAEMDEGRVVSVSDGQITVLEEGLDQPYMVAVADDGVVVTERGGGRVLYIAAETVVLAQGLEKPGRVIAHGDQAWWIDEDAGELWMADLSSLDADVLADLDDPMGLSWTEDGVLVTQAGSCDCLTLVDVDSGAQDDLVDVEENPIDVLATDAGVFMSAESHYWPYGGWMYSVDVAGEDADSLSYSPPGPSWLAANESHLFWVSDENIVAVSHDGGSYQALAILTAPGDLVATDDGLVWTDRQRGAIFTVAAP